MLNIKYIAFILLSLLPIFLQLIIPPYGNRIVFASFFLLIATSFGVSFNFSKLSNNYRKIILINIFMVIILFYQMVVFNDFSNIYWKMIFPFVLTSILIFYYHNFSDREQKILQISINILVFSFIIQFLLSVIESLQGSFIVSQYNWALKSYSYLNQDTFINRFLFGSLNIFNPFLFLKFGLSGLYGQHNMWALQLPFYNLIFAFAYIKTKNKYLLYLLIFIILAQLLNTTRTGIFAVLFTDLLIYLKFFYKRNFLFNTLLTAILIPLLIISYEVVYDFFARYFTRFDTFTIRTDIYISAIDYVYNSGSSLLAGMGYNEMGKLVTLFLSLQNYNVELKSFENGYLDILFLYGIIGFALFLYLIKQFLAGSNTTDVKFFAKLLVTNIFILGFTISHIFQVHVYPYVIFAFILFNNYKPTILRSN